MRHHLRVGGLELLDGVGTDVQMRKEEVAIGVPGLSAPLGIAFNENHLKADF
jgi:hypothetical protein